MRLVASGLWAQAWPSSPTRGQSVRTVRSDPEDPPHPHGHPRRSPGAREAGAAFLHRNSSPFLNAASLEMLVFRHELLVNVQHFAFWSWAGGDRRAWRAAEPCSGGPGGEAAVAGSSPS